MRSSCQAKGARRNTAGVPPVHSSGEPLAPWVRASMESRFGHDFSQVRVHADGSAAESAGALRASAYTLGDDVVFGAGRYQPGSQNGQRLLAHELTHVVQQSSWRAGPAVSSIDALEREAERNAHAPFAEPLRVREWAMRSAPLMAPAVACKTTFAKATSFASLIDLVRAAEAKLAAAGITAAADQIHVLRGIYYGTDLSMDFRKEKSPTRNLGFQLFTQSTTPQDPRTILDCGLFDALLASPEVVDPKSKRHVDVGHLIIGLDARNATIPGLNFPGFGGTGTEIVTWLGDLGGGAARLSVLRSVSPKKSASAVFRGSDYGGSVNLEGDVAGFVAASGGSSSVVAPTFAPGKRLSDALDDYLSPKGASTEWKGRAASFLTMHKATFTAAGVLDNRSALVTRFGSQILDFACEYFGQRLIDGKLTKAQILAACDWVGSCAEEVAEAFVDALDDARTSGGRIEAKRFPAIKAKKAGCPSVVKSLKAGKSARSFFDDAKKSLEKLF
jgi:hypothetical protein